MSRSKHWTCGFVSMMTGCLLALTVAPAAADVAIPPRPKPNVNENGSPAPFVVRRDPSEATSRILIPRKLLPAARALLPTTNSHAAVAPGEEDAESANFARRTANAGCMLAFAFAGGGLAIAFVRRHKGGMGKILAIGLAVSMLLLGTALADVPSPFGGGRRPRPGPPIPAPSATSTIKVEIVDSGDAIVLILGRSAPDLPK